jgi:hypothetical protein
MKNNYIRSVILGGLCVLWLAGELSCMKYSTAKPYKAQPTVIVVDRDAAPAADASSIVSDSQATPSDAATVSDVLADVIPDPGVDGSQGSYLPIHPSDVFPDCVGTDDQMNDCIVNLPTRAGIPVTRPEPMDYALCKP